VQPIGSFRFQGQQFEGRAKIGMSVDDSITHACRRGKPVGPAQDVGGNILEFWTQVWVGHQAGRENQKVEDVFAFRRRDDHPFGRILHVEPWGAEMQTEAWPLGRPFEGIIRGGWFRSKKLTIIRYFTGSDRAGNRGIRPELSMKRIGLTVGSCCRLTKTWT
jgi:hypothetical protein